MSAVATRRGLLGGTALLTAGVLPAAAGLIEAPNADAVLIALAQEHARLEPAIWSDDFDVSEPAENRRYKILQEARSIPARSHDGVAAKARLLRDEVSYATNDVDTVGPTAHELAWSIVQDLIGGVVA